MVAEAVSSVGDGPMEAEAGIVTEDGLNGLVTAEDGFMEKESLACLVAEVVAEEEEEVVEEVKVEVKAEEVKVEEVEDKEEEVKVEEVEAEVVEVKMEG